MDITDASPAESQSTGKNYKRVTLFLKQGATLSDGIFAAFGLNASGATAIWEVMEPNTLATCWTDSQGRRLTICVVSPPPLESCDEPTTKKS